MNNCHARQSVSNVSLKWQVAQRRKCLEAWYKPSGKCKKKVCPCHITTNMPLKSFAVSKCTQLITNTWAGCFSFNEHLRYCNTKDQPGCIEADRLSGSCFQIYFHDKHLFQIHHVLLLLSASHVILGEKKSLTACIDTNKVSRPWTLIMFWIISHHFHFG